MKEKNLIEIIKNLLESDYIGDDCAYLKDLDITITQDSLVEDVHFKRNFITPYQLGYKSVMVNLSDIAASGAQPAYLTISISIPADISENYIEEFYDGCKAACGEDIKIVGGDITGSEKIFISVCAIGKTRDRNISSRKNACIGQKLVVCGVHGSSAAGLELLLKNKKEPEKLIKSHLEPFAQIDFGSIVSTQVKSPYAMMDTSDGLADALSVIANESNVLLEIDFEKIPHDKEIEEFPNWKEWVLFGGEDYGIVATVPQDFKFGTEIGQVKEGNGISLNIDNQKIHLSKTDVENKIFNHFN